MSVLDVDTEDRRAIGRLLLASGVPLPGPISLSVRGSSMAPTLVDGQIVVVEPAPAGEGYRLGDVIVTRHDDGLVIHRLATLRGELAITRGDARVAPDAPVRIGSIIGRVVGAPRRPLHRRWLRRCARSLPLLIASLALRVHPTTATLAACGFTWLERSVLPRARGLKRHRPSTG